MKRLLSLLFLFLIITAVQAQKVQVPVLDFDQFEPLLHKQNDTVYVINFWATWCVPCVKELPDFEKLNLHHQGEKFKMILVSLDFKSSLQNRLLPFIEKNQLKADVIMLHAPDANAWIDRVDASWSGAIPATLIYKREKRVFREGSFTYEELESVVKPLIK